MLKSLKTLVTLFAVMGFLAGCTSSGSSEEEVDTAAQAEADRLAAEQAARDAEAAAAAAAAAKCDNAESVFYFDFDQSILLSEAKAALLVQAECAQMDGGSIRLEGHADERGSREYNMALGERRANAVRDYLVLQGVDAAVIETVSYGEERPVEVGSYESAWSKNRRVELK
jgi:peptidoglycan-associated lipoprotein